MECCDQQARKLRDVSSRFLALLLCLFLAPVAASADGIGTTADDTVVVTEPTGSVTLREAVSAALAGNPELTAFSTEVRAREALTLQAALRPNPTLRAEVENVGGSGQRRGFEDTETTLLLSQLIELGDKRPKRERLAALEAEIATWDYQAKRLDVLTRAVKAFIAVLSAQERLTLATHLEGLAKQGVDTVSRSVAAGASPPVETTRARVTLGRATIERTSAEKTLATARAALAASWGGSAPLFTNAAGDLTRLPPVPAEARFLEALPQSPDLLRWDTEQRERDAALELEKARRIPDITVGGGGRHFNDNDDNALVFEVDVPLPLFDRNQGAIIAARERASKARHETRAAEVSARLAVHEAYQRLSAASERAASLRATVLPAARESRAGTLVAFGKGLLRPLDLLESQRSLFELEADYVTALEEAHLAAADLERLTGVPLKSPSGETR